MYLSTSCTVTNPLWTWTYLPSAYIDLCVHLFTFAYIDLVIDLIIHLVIHLSTHSTLRKEQISAPFTQISMSPYLSISRNVIQLYHPHSTNPGHTQKIGVLHSPYIPTQLRVFPLHPPSPHPLHEGSLFTSR
jgi:hypothetical protein